MSLKSHASDKLAHLLEACLDIVKFYQNDENETSTQSDISLVFQYVEQAIDEL